MGIATEMMDKLNTAVVACDRTLQVTYANPACKQAFKALLNMEDFVGKIWLIAINLDNLLVKLQKMFQEYKDKTRKLDYYTMDVPTANLPLSHVPVYDGDSIVRSGGGYSSRAHWRDRVRIRQGRLRPCFF